MKHIAVFFLITAAAGLPLCAAREIVLQGYSPALMSRISETDRMLNTLFRLKRFRSGSITLEITGKRNTSPQLEVSRGRMRLTLDLDKSVFDDNSSYRALLSALVLSSGASVVFDGGPRALPAWLCAGIRHKAAARSSTERYLHGLHHLPAVSALYCQGKLPDLLTLPELSPDLPPELSPDLPPELQSWYDEFARVLLETAIDQKLLRVYASELFLTQKYQKPAEKLVKSLSAALSEKDQLGRFQTVEKILWNSYKPEPASRKLRLLPEMLKWKIPELDKEGKPTEKMIDCSLLELHPLLAERPDAAELRKKASARAGSFHSGCTYRESELFNRFAILLHNTPRDIEETQKMLKRTYDSILTLLNRREKLEKYLEETESKHISAVQSMKQLLSVQRGTDTASPAQKKFLLETEKTYGD